MSPQAGWILQEEIVPRLRTLIPRSVRAVGCEDVEELTQDGTAIAAQMLHSAELAGKKVTPGNIAHYAVQHMKSGRRSTGSSQVDVLHVGTQLAGRTRLSSLDEPVGPDPENGETLSFSDAIADENEDPFAIAARKMDWDAFCSRLSERERRLVEYISDGKSFREAARAFGLSDSGIQGIKRMLASAIREFMGGDILADIGQTPAWKAGLTASRERNACRKGQRHS